MLLLTSALESIKYQMNPYRFKFSLAQLTSGFFFIGKITCYTMKSLSYNDKLCTICWVFIDHDLFRSTVKHDDGESNKNLLEIF